MRHLLVVAATMLVAGCVTTSLTHDGSKVRITSNSAVVENCKYIGQVKGEDRMNGGLLGQGAAEENATRRLQNGAADIGADTVMLATSTTGFSGATIRGEAYRCTT